MAEYIDKSAVLAKIDEFVKLNEEHGFPVDAFDMAILSNVIVKMPADVARVVRGRWTQVDDTKCRCSNCDIIALIGLYPHGDKNYCPNCGAKMDEEEHNNV